MDLGILGFTRWRKITPELVRAGVHASPHLWMWTPRPYCVAHLAAGVGNIDILEGIPGKAAGIDYSAYTMKDGRLQVPPLPGFGLRLESELLGQPSASAKPTSGVRPLAIMRRL